MRYSRERILSVLYPVIEDAFGIDPDERPLPEESIDGHLKRLKVWDEVDLADLVFGCEKAFGFRLAFSEWKAFFDGGVDDPAEWERTVAPRLTYERLADFIAEKIPAISFAPVEIAGRFCGPAGAFLGVREAARLILPRVERFAPSTPILSHLRRGHVEALWRRLAFDHGESLPPLRTCPSDQAAGPAFLWVVGMGMPAAAALCSGLADVSLIFVALAAPAVLLYFALRHSETPLPEGIVTFGDLARRLAEADSAGAAK